MQSSLTLEPNPFEQSFAPKASSLGGSSDVNGQGIGEKDLENDRQLSTAPSTANATPTGIPSNSAIFRNKATENRVTSNAPARTKKEIPSITELTSPAPLVPNQLPGNPIGTPLPLLGTSNGSGSTDQVRAAGNLASQAGHIRQMAQVGPNGHVMPINQIGHMAHMGQVGHVGQVGQVGQFPLGHYGQLGMNQMGQSNQIGQYGHMGYLAQNHASGQLTPSWPVRAGQVTPGILGNPGSTDMGVYNQLGRNPALPSPGVSSILSMPMDGQSQHLASSSISSGASMPSISSDESIPTSTGSKPMPATDSIPAHVPSTAPQIRANRGRGRSGEKVAANGLYTLSKSSDGAVTGSTASHIAKIKPGRDTPSLSMGIRVDSSVTKLAKKSLNSNTGRIGGDSSMKGDKVPQGSSDDERRRQFLERNRLAAIKCRQRKKRFVDELKSKVDLYSQAHEESLEESRRLRYDCDQLCQFITAHHSTDELPMAIMQIIEQYSQANRQQQSQKMTTKESTAD